MHSTFRALVALFAIASAAFAHAQFGPARIIDNGATASGISSIATADLNNDGLLDVVCSNGYNVGHITVYLQSADGLAGATAIVIDSEAGQAEEVTTGDLNGDGWTDVVAVCRLNEEVLWYPNTNGTFGEGIVLDSASLFLNGVVAGDLDGNGTVDLVVIGQHLIDLYRNDGTGTFNKEAILTTSTSPNILECMDLVLADVDGDEDLDPVTAETICGVAYRNAGNATFTPELADPMPAAMQRVRMGDVDGDGHPDMVLSDFLGGMRWYRNQGATWTAEGALLAGVTVRAFGLLDMDADGLADLVVASPGGITYHPGLGNGSFATAVLLYQDGSAFLDEVTLSDVNNDGRPDVLWSGPAGTLAYHVNELPTAIATTRAASDFSLSPDPDGTHLVVHFSSAAPQHVLVLDVQGRPLRSHQQLRSGERISMHGLPAGTYLLRSGNGATLRWVKP